MNQVIQCISLKFKEEGQMKKIFSFLLLTVIVATTAFAKNDTLTHEQLVEKYLTISGQKQALEKMPTQMVNMIEQQFAQSGQPVDPKLGDIIIESFVNEEAIGKLTQDIQKLSSSDLHKLIAFYQTQTGQKCVKLNKEEDMEDMNQQLPLFVQELNTNPPSQDRINHMNTMFTETNLLAGTLEMVEAVTRIFNASLPKEEQMSDAQIEGLMMQSSQPMAQQLIVTFYYALRNFTDSEIEEVVRMTLTPEGQAETDAQLAGMIAYISTAANDLVSKISKENDK
jgi:hypothetical protein